MDDYYRVPTLALLGILVTVFAALYSRSRTLRRFLWLVGWTMAFVRLALLMSPQGQQGIGLAISNSSMELAALMFLGSMSATHLGRKVRVRYLVAFAVPLIFFSVLVSFFPTPGPWLHGLDFAIALAAAAAAVHWSAQKNLLPVWFTVSLSVAVSAVCLYFVFVGRYDSVLGLAHGSNCLITALLVLWVYRRWSPGVVFTATGLLIWSIPPLVVQLLQPSDPVLVIALRIFNLIKVMTAVGMIVLVLEEELTLNEKAQSRDRRSRAEMEQYSKLDLSVVPYRDFGVHYDEACEVIVQSSPFMQAAILLRGVENSYRVAGRAGMDSGLIAALDAMGRRLTTEMLSALCKHSWDGGERGNRTPLDMRPVMGPGDDLERWNFARAYAIPMVGRSEGLQGVLLLSRLVSPAEPLMAEDLLPLELLVARLVAARENNILLRRVAQSEKLAGLGQLAGGMAHELNNPLTVVMGYAEIIEDCETDEMVRRSAGVIRGEAQRMKRTIESLARFWKSSASNLSPISAADMLAEIADMHAAVFARAGIEFDVVIAAGLPRIRANGDQVRQVVQQLLHNSAAALVSSEGLQEKKVCLHAALVKERVQILVSDTGPAFPNPDRAFDPFVVSRQPGEDPGLGLSLCYSIIREHGGEISAFNLQPFGAAVTIDLPVDAPQKDSAIVGELFAL